MKTFCSIFLTGALLINAAIAAEPEWKAGRASAKITPDKPVLLAGYASRTKPFERVEQDLFAKALALQDRAGRRGVIVTTDLVGISAAILDPVCQRITNQTGLKREEILVNWSHTHSGPTLLLNANPSPNVPATDTANTIAYTRWLQDRLVEIVVQALSRLEPAQLSWGSGLVHFPMNRREFTTNGVILGVNARGLADRSVPVLRVDGEDGKPRAVLFGCACHNTTLTDKNYLVAGDYAGFAAAHVQEHFPGAQAMFMQNCGGDANPYPRGTMELARQHGTELGQEVGRLLGTQLKPVHGPLTPALDYAVLPLQALPRDALQKLADKSPSWQIGNARTMLGLHDRGLKPPADFRAPVAVWQFGGDLTLVALSGEVVVDYVPLLERELGPLQLWVAGYSNDYFGYFPSAQVIRDGGYETRGLSNGSGWFAPAAQDALVKKVRELAKQVGRKLPE
jgi:neutral ceramidase